MPETPAQMLDRVAKLCQPGPYQIIGGEDDRQALEWALETRGELLLQVTIAQRIYETLLPGSPDSEIQRATQQLIASAKQVIAKATGGDALGGPGITPHLILTSPELLTFVEEVVADLDASQGRADLRPEYADMLRRGLELIALAQGTEVERG